MSFSKAKTLSPKAEKVSVTAEALTVDLSDGRTIAVPLEWYPRLVQGNLAERNNWRLIGKGQGIHSLNAEC